MKKQSLLIVVVVFTLVNTVFFVKQFIKSEEPKKIAYVRSQELVYGFNGMQEAQDKFEVESQLVLSRLDTLKMDYQKSLANFQKNFSTYTEDEKKQMEALLEVQYQNVVKYNQEMSEKMNQEEEEMLSGVLNQVNSFAKEYGEKKGYDLIFGTTLSGNILYATEVLDITEEVMVEMNRMYLDE